MRLVPRALWDAVLMFMPQKQIRAPIFFVVYCSMLFMIFSSFVEPSSFSFWVTGLLGAAVFFANFAESLATRHAKAQAAFLHRARANLWAKKLNHANAQDFTRISASELKKGDFVLVETGDIVPADGEVIEGVASVDESAVTGESAPVIRENTPDHRAVTWSSKVLSNRLVVRITNSHGGGTLRHLTNLLSRTHRTKTPSETALEIFLVSVTLSALVAVVTLYSFSAASVAANRTGSVVTAAMLAALLGSMVPTTIGGLLSPIGIAAINRLLRLNIVATSSRAVEAAGDINTLLIDKTGTITYGNRQAVAFFPAPSVSMRRLVDAALEASIADETPEGKSIVALARKQEGAQMPALPPDNAFIPFAAQTRVSGVQKGEHTILKGAHDVIEAYVLKRGGAIPDETTAQSASIARQGATPLWVCENNHILGLIQLKDVIKHDIKNHLMVLRILGVRSMMITGDNPLTAASVAAESGVDDFIAQAVPETKLDLIRKLQEEGQNVAMIGDGVNDAPALAQANVAVVMDSGSDTAKEAATMIDLDSDPGKMIEIVRIGKQTLVTRGAITTFSLLSDLVKYFTIVPAAFISTYPLLDRMNFLRLSGPQNAMIAGLLFNALVLFALTPLALHGVRFHAKNPNALLLRNVTIFGLGAMIAPLVCIKLLDLLLLSFRGAL